MFKNLKNLQELQWRATFQNTEEARKKFRNAAQIDHKSIIVDTVTQIVIRTAIVLLIPGTHKEVNTAGIQIVRSNSPLTILNKYTVEYSVYRAHTVSDIRTRYVIHESQGMQGQRRKEVRERTFDLYTATLLNYILNIEQAIEPAYISSWVGSIHCWPRIPVRIESSVRSTRNP